MDESRRFQETSARREWAPPRLVGAGRGRTVSGVLLLDETLSRPTWHIVVAVIGLGLALAGAVVISLAHEAAKEEVTGDSPTGEPVAAV